MEYSPGSGFTHAKAIHKTMYGRAAASEVKEGTHSLKEIPYITNISQKGNDLVFNVASGSYAFSYPVKMK